MKVLKPLTSLLLLAQCLYGQKSKPGQPSFQALTQRDAVIEKSNHNCVRRTNHSLQARIQNYPFNLSSEIQFVSFDGLVKITEDKEFIFISSDPELLITNDITLPSTAKESLSLTFPQIDKLTDILYNYGFAGPIISQKKFDCYSPRNAILFRDHNGKALAFIEICFECLNTRESSERILPGQMCDQKLDMIKELFRQVGIKYGVQNSVQ